MHQHRIFDRFEQVAGGAQLRTARRGAGADLEIDELDAVALAGATLQQVAAAQTLAAQIDDGADAELRERADVMRRGLGRALGLAVDGVPVEVDHAENTMVYEQHVQVRCGRAQALPEPVRRTVRDLPAPTEGDALDGAPRLFAENMHPLEFGWRLKTLRGRPRADAALRQSGFVQAEYPL